MINQESQANMSMLRLRSPSQFDEPENEEEQKSQRRQSILNRNNSILKTSKKPLSILSQSDFFSLTPKSKYYWHAWIPENRLLIGVVILFHGLHEHSGRYKALAEKLCDTGLVVFGVDLLGHGRSDGKKGYTESFEIWVQQAEHFYSCVSQKIPWTKSPPAKDKEPSTPVVNNNEMNFYLPQFKGLPIFMFGQGIGGTVSLFAAKKNPDIAGVVLSAPLLQIPKQTHYILQKLAAVIATLTPTARVVDIAFNQRCHNEQEIEAFKNDPLCCQEKMCAKTGYVLLELTKDMTKHFSDVSFPFVVMQGTDDRFCDPAGAKALHELAASKDKTIMLYEGFWHDLLHEVCSDEFITKTTEWIAKKCGVKIGK